MCECERSCISPLVSSLSLLSTVNKKIPSVFGSSGPTQHWQKPNTEGLGSNYNKHILVINMKTYRQATNKQLHSTECNSRNAESIENCGEKRFKKYIQKFHTQEKHDYSFSAVIGITVSTDHTFSCQTENYIMLSSSLKSCFLAH